MPNYITVTTQDANHIKVVFNDYYTDGVVDTLCAYYNRTDIEKVEVYANVVIVHVLDSSQDWQLSDTQNLSEGILQIDNIDGTTTWADLDTLAAQIAALMVA